MPVARLYGGCIMFPAEATASVLHAWREWAPTLTEDTTTSVALLRLPPRPGAARGAARPVRPDLRVVHLGSADEGAAVLAPMRAVATPLMDPSTTCPTRPSTPCTWTRPPRCRSTTAA